MYNSIWVDCIVKAKSQGPSGHRWKIITMTLMSLAMVLNLLLVINIIQLLILKRTFYAIDLYFLPASLKVPVEFLIRFVLPVVAINYLLIFRNDRYQKLISKYPYRNGNLFLGYFLGSIALPIVLLWIGIIASHAS